MLIKKLAAYLLLKDFLKNENYFPQTHGTFKNKHSFKGSYSKATLNNGTEILQRDKTNERNTEISKPFIMLWREKEPLTLHNLFNFFKLKTHSNPNNLIKQLSSILRNGRYENIAIIQDGKTYPKFIIPINKEKSNFFEVNEKLEEVSISDSDNIELPELDADIYEEIEVEENFNAEDVFLQESEPLNLSKIKELKFEGNSVSVKELRTKLKENNIQTSLENIFKLSGLTEGLTNIDNIDISMMCGSVMVSYESENIKCGRELRLEEKEINNITLNTKSGGGINILLSQIIAAKKLGIEKIHCIASKATSLTFDSFDDYNEDKLSKNQKEKLEGIVKETKQMKLLTRKLADNFPEIRNFSRAKLRDLKSSLVRDYIKDKNIYPNLQIYLETDESPAAILASINPEFLKSSFNNPIKDSISSLLSKLQGSKEFEVLQNTAKNRNILLKDFITTKPTIVNGPDIGYMIWPKFGYNKSLSKIPHYTIYDSLQENILVFDDLLHLNNMTLKEDLLSNNKAETFWMLFGVSAELELDVNDQNTFDLLCNYVNNKRGK